MLVTHGATLPWNFKPGVDGAKVDYEDTTEVADIAETDKIVEPWMYKKIRRLALL